MASRSYGTETERNPGPWAANQGVLTSLKAKRARAVAGPRTSAAHAQWAEIDLGDVAPVIELTKELIGAHLA